MRDTSYARPYYIANFGASRSRLSFRLGQSKFAWPRSTAGRRSRLEQKKKIDRSGLLGCAQLQLESLRLIQDSQSPFKRIYRSDMHSIRGTQSSHSSMVHDRPPVRPRLVVILDSDDASLEIAAMGNEVTTVGIGARSQDDIVDAANCAGIRLDDAKAVMLRHTVSVDEGALAMMPNLQFVVRLGAGYDNVDINACGKRGIGVANVPSYGTEEVADSATCML